MIWPTGFAARGTPPKMARYGRFEWEQILISLDCSDTSHQRSTVIGIGLALATHYNAASHSAYPSLETLAREFGSKPTTVRSVLAFLEDVGLLRVDWRGPGAGAHNTNHYHFLTPDTTNSPAEDHFTPHETEPQRTVSQHQNPPPEEQKQNPTGKQTGPSGTTNNKEQQENSAAPNPQELEELKREHSDLWMDALKGVPRHNSAGETIHSPKAYAVPGFLEMVEVRLAEGREDAARTQETAATANCDRCDERSLYWEDQEPPYGPRAFKCDHRMNRTMTDREPVHT
jgi:hypothetical protein